MTNPSFDVVAVGNAIVDIIQPTPDAFLAAHEIQKGAMTLIEEERALYLTALFDKAEVAAGGSAANTVTGIASLGGAAGFIGIVADDAMGEKFISSFRAVGATFNTPPRHGPPGTARSMIAVTPDGQRSMNTYLGVASLLEPAHIDPGLVQRVVMIRRPPSPTLRPDATPFRAGAAEIARAADRKVALTLSDGFCVERHRDSFIHLIANHIDVLLCNEDELLRLYQTADFEAALTRARAECPLVACTRSAKGAVIGQGAEIVHVAAEPVGRVVDTTGAGDQFAAGFLYGVAKGRSLADCGKLGVMAAAEVISHIGPRPIVSLAGLAEQRGL